MAIRNRQEIIEFLKTDYTTYFTTCHTDADDAICGTELNTALTAGQPLIGSANNPDVGALVIDFIDNGIDSNGDGTADLFVINQETDSKNLIAEGLKNFYSAMLLQLYPATAQGQATPLVLLATYAIIYNDMFDHMSDAMTLESEVIPQP